MSSRPGTRRPAAFRRAALTAATALAATLCLPLAGAAADEPAGTPVVGRLVQAWPEKGPDEQHGAGHEASHEASHEAGSPLSWVETADGAVRVPTADLPGVPAGATVELTVGADVHDEGAEEHGLEPAQEVLSTGSVTPAATAPTPRRPVTNQVTVVLVAPAGTRPDPEVTAREVAATVDGPVAEFWSEQTDDVVRFGVSRAHGWIRTAAGCADPTELWREAADAVGFRSGPGRHLMLHLSSQTARQPGCSYALAEVGAGPTSGGRLYVRDLLPSVVAHELGHNLGLSHSSALQCDGAVETGRCRTAGYRDPYDVMGVSWRQLGSLSAPQAALLGALPAARTLDLGVHDDRTSVSLAPLGDRTGTRAVRLTDAEGTAYWLEYRTATGRDGWLGRPEDNRYGLETGVLVRRTADFPDTALLLDGTPGPAARWDDDRQATLPVGEPVVLADGAFTVTVRDLADDGAVLDVLPAAPAQAAAPVAPRASGEGQVLAGSGRAATTAPVGGSPTAAGAAGEPAPHADPDVHLPAPVDDGGVLDGGVLDDAAVESTAVDSAAVGTPAGPAPAGGLVVAGAVTGLAGLLLLALRLRRR